jgi:hypothetical protein
VLLALLLPQAARTDADVKRIAAHPRAAWETGMVKHSCGSEARSATSTARMRKA